VASRSKSPLLAASCIGVTAPNNAAANLLAPGRLAHGPPIAVIDIGSNSVRLIIYEGLARSPTPTFNEKVLAGLGREVQSTGLLPADAVEKALAALRRFRALCNTVRVERVLVLATAACRDASNGPAFIAAAERICATSIEVLSGQREAQLSALGVLSGMHRPDGIVGDLGGGSLELVDLHASKIGEGITLPLGGLALLDISAKSLRKAEKFVKKTLADIPELDRGSGRHFYAVGGTWRALARLHMWQIGYPLHVMHNYLIPAREALEFSRLVHRVSPEMLSRIEVVSDARRPLLAYAALVLEHVVRRTKPKNVIISALGVREGLLYSMLEPEERKKDPLLAAARELNLLRSRSPVHGEELIAWTDLFVERSRLDETAEERRLRHAGCLLADIGWRTHPDYRGEQSLNLVAHAAFVGIDHPGRAFLAMTVFFRHAGLVDNELSPRLPELATTRILDRARVLGAAMRVAFLISAAMPGVLPRAPLFLAHGRLVLELDAELAPLAGERLFNRLKQLARLIGREPVIITG
jgi:exopolyphosphatase / guanosine-5'-triphosphate,3'-diphosphate pyrophosphatase